jgi:hypothetical protein
MRLASIALLILVGACAPVTFQRGPKPDPNVEGQFTRALTLLEPGASAAAMDTATNLLDAYLAHGGYVARRPEAVALRRLATDAIQLSKVASALQQERADNRSKASDAPAAQRTDNDSLKEIQRLKDELAEANAELERIKKRLATQKP